MHHLRSTYQRTEGLASACHSRAVHVAIRGATNARLDGKRCVSQQKRWINIYVRVATKEMDIYIFIYLHLFCIVVCIYIYIYIIYFIYYHHFIIIWCSYVHLCLKLYLRRMYTFTSALCSSFVFVFISKGVYTCFMASGPSSNVTMPTRPSGVSSVPNAICSTTPFIKANRT